MRRGEQRPQGRRRGGYQYAASALKPPEYLNKHEAAIWSEVLNATDPQRFKRSEAPLLATYCTAAAMARFYSARIGAEGDQGSNHETLDRKRATGDKPVLTAATIPFERYEQRRAARTALQRAGYQPTLGKLIAAVDFV